MQVVGLNFKKILAERTPEFKNGSAINTSIEFTDLEKNKVDMIKESDVIEIYFRYTILYTEPDPSKKDTPQKKVGELCFEGVIIASLSKEELKEILKQWKKKEIPSGIKLALFNLILRKCAPKALNLEEDVGLPSHIPFPQLRPKAQEDSSQN